MRPKLHLVYFALAAFDLLTVSLGLWLINRVVTIYTESVQTNEVWASRLNDYSDLSRLAVAVNAPGNDVFASSDVEGEAARLEEALDRFHVKAAAARADIEDNVDAAEAPELLAALGAIDTAIVAMAADAQLIFSYLRNGEHELAGRRMAAMDRDYARVNVTLAELSRRVGAIQKTRLDQQTARAASLSRFEYLIGALIVVMVVGVTLYGHKLARRMKETADVLARHRNHLKELVAQRTQDLEVSHEQLRLAERLASIGTLAAGLGHDMHNVLFPVRCRLDALETAGLGEAGAAEVESLRSSVEYLQQLSDGLRMLAVDPDDPDASAETTDVASWIEFARPLFQTALPAAATLNMEKADELPSVAVAPHRLTQALFNLVVNAGDAIGGRGTVTVRAQAHDGGRLVRFSVADDGAGMSPEVRRQALDPFFTTKTRRFGTGLGLALVHGVTRSCGGTVEISSSPGRGTTVVLMLPAAACVEPGDDAGEPQVRWAWVSLSDARQDAFVAALLQSAGFKVGHADDAAPAGGCLWITDAGLSSAAGARRFLNGSACRRVIVLGASDEGWDQARVTRLRRQPGLEEIRRALDASSGSIGGGP